MAGSPNFVTAPQTEVNSVSTANTARDGTGTITTVFTAGASGSRITSIRCVATGDPADSIVNLFLHDGVTAWFYDSIDMGNPAAASTTVEAYKAVTSYTDLLLPSGWSLRASITAALTAGVVNVFAHGGDF